LIRDCTCQVGTISHTSYLARSKCRDGDTLYRKIRSNHKWRDYFVWWSNNSCVHYNDI